ncbi:MAG: hypothetical protein RTU92_01990, partial [Candidatus Thorarchaeota archaeon]
MKTPIDYDMFSSIHAWIFPDVQPVPESTKADIFSRLLSVDGELVPVSVSQKGSTISVSYPYSRVDKRALRDKLSWIFGLNVVTHNAVAVIQDEPQVRYIADLVKTIRPYSADTLYEALIKTIIQQQISYKAANVLTKRLILSLSKSENFQEHTFYTFPEPAAIVKAGADHLRTLGFGYKTDYILGTSKLVNSRELVIDDLIGYSYDEVYRLLKPIRGIGEWTIQVLAIAGLGIFSTYP